MELEQIEQLYKAFCWGWFKNSFTRPKIGDGEVHYMNLFKREFRDYCVHQYDFDPITAIVTRPEHWVQWTNEIVALAA